MNVITALTYKDAREEVKGRLGAGIFLGKQPELKSLQLAKLPQAYSRR